MVVVTFGNHYIKGSAVLSTDLLHQIIRYFLSLRRRRKRFQLEIFQSCRDGFKKLAFKAGRHLLYAAPQPFLKFTSFHIALANKQFFENQWAIYKEFSAHLQVEFTQVHFGKGSPSPTALQIHWYLIKLLHSAYFGQCLVLCMPKVNKYVQRMFGHTWGGLGAKKPS